MLGCRFGYHGDLAMALVWEFEGTPSPRKSWRTWVSWSLAMSMWWWMIVTRQRRDDRCCLSTYEHTERAQFGVLQTKKPTDQCIRLDDQQICSLIGTWGPGVDDTTIYNGSPLSLCLYASQSGLSLTSWNCHMKLNQAEHVLCHADLKQIKSIHHMKYVSPLSFLEIRHLWWSSDSSNFRFRSNLPCFCEALAALASPRAGAWAQGPGMCGPTPKRLRWATGQCHRQWWCRHTFRGRPMRNTHKGGRDPYIRMNMQSRSHQKLAEMFCQVSDRCFWGILRVLDGFGSYMLPAPGLYNLWPWQEGIDDSRSRIGSPTQTLGHLRTCLGLACCMTLDPNVR